MSRKTGLITQRTRAAWMFLTPMLLVLAAVALYPLAQTIWFGFTDASLNDLDGAEWVGFRNYLEWFDYGNGQGEWDGLLVDERWWRAVWNTLKFAFVSVFFETLFGLIIALVLNAQFPGRAIVRTAVLVPWAIPTVRNHQRHAHEGRPDLGPHRLDSDTGNSHGRGDDGGYLENDAVHGAADPRGPSDDPG